VDLDAGLIHVRRALIERGGNLELSLPKNDKTRIVVFQASSSTSCASTCLAAWLRNLRVTFSWGNGGGTPRRGNWRNVARWPESVAKAGLPVGLHFHDLRHTGNHLAAQTGASTRELMQRMGHSTVRAAMVYQHATDARSRHLADRLDALIREQRGTS